LKSWWKASVI